jgi:hypothetical protein
VIPYNVVNSYFVSKKTLSSSVSWRWTQQVPSKRYRKNHPTCISSISPSGYPSGNALDLYSGGSRFESADTPAIVIVFTFSSVPPGKYRNNTSIRPQSLPSSSFTVRCLPTGSVNCFFFLVSLGGVRLSPLGTWATTGLLCQPRMIDDECGAVGGMRIGRENRSTRRKPAPTPLWPPQIPHDLTWDRTRAAAWAIARPCVVK